MNRQKAIQTMSHLVGNAAAHLALYPDSRYAIREVVLYEGQAQELAQARRWNETEITLFRAKSIQHAANEIQKRKDDYKRRTFQALLSIATQEIDTFINQELKR